MGLQQLLENMSQRLNIITWKNNIPRGLWSVKSWYKVRIWYGSQQTRNSTTTITNMRMTLFLARVAPVNSWINRFLLILAWEILRHFSTGSLVSPPMYREQTLYSLFLPSLRRLRTDALSILWRFYGTYKFNRDSYIGKFCRLFKFAPEIPPEIAFIPSILKPAKDCVRKS